MMLTSSQQQLWFIDEFHHGLPAHNLPAQLRLRGRLDLAAFRRAIDGLVARHAALRTRLPAGEDGMPVQATDPAGPVRLEFTDLTGMRASAAERRLGEIAQAEAVRPFQLASGWPVRAHLVRLHDRDHALVLVVHQLAFDEASLGIAVADLAALYETEVSGRAPACQGPKLTFGEHALGEPARLTAEDEAYWRDALAGLPTSRFPADRPRPLLASHDGAVEHATIDAAVLAGLRQLAGQLDTSLHALLLAALDVLLYRHTGQTDLVVGTASPNRAGPGLADLVGFVEATLPVRTSLDGDPSFTELTGRVAAALAGAVAHQGLPFARIVDLLGVERDTGRFPVFQTWLRCREPASQVTGGGVTFEVAPVDLRASRYDIGLDVQPGEDGLEIALTYPPVLFDTETVRRLLGHLEVLLRGIVASPDTPLSGLPLLTGAELRRELAEWNDTARDFPRICIHEGFEQQVRRTPDAIAAEYGPAQNNTERVTYAQLDAMANSIAAALRDAGVGPELLAGVCMQTSITRLAALLGIWKAGGGYVPLDPGLPAERLSYMIGDTAMKVIVTDKASAASLPPAGVPVLTLDVAGAVAVADACGPLPGRAVPSNVAYVIYTSGSTGQPKGVVVEHRHAINFLQGMVQAWHIGPDSAVLSFAAYTFDVSVMDFFMPLLAGAKVVMAPPETLHSPPRLAALIRESKVTFACLPPAVLSLLTGEDFPGLQTLLSAGEELTSELLRHWLRDGLEIYNGYGPTECAIGATFMRLEPATQLPPPIGRPKPNYQAYVLDEHLNPVPVGVTGELHIGGAGVTRGYLNRPELTAEKFIEDPFRPGGRLYKTGDLVRRRADGTLVFAGRIDHQVKINGLRVELGEIEAAMTSHPAVRQAVVTVTTSPGGAKQLAGYLVGPAAPADLRAHLAQKLPSYMIPGYLITLDELPLTTNGKIDKAALPAPESALTAAPPVPPRTLIETVLVDLYATILGAEELGAADSFFDAGGNSLQALRLVAQLYSELAVDLDVSAVFLAPTPRQLAAVLRDKHGFEDADLDTESLELL